MNGILFRAMLEIVGYERGTIAVDKEHVILNR